LPDAEPERKSRCAEAFFLLVDLIFRDERALDEDAVPLS
jgi:hypothetical protein